MGGCCSCFRLVPWASLAATAVSWTGTVLFCAAGHEAILNSYHLLNSANIPGFVLRYVINDSQLAVVTYIVVGISSFMCAIALRFLQHGRAANAIVRSDIRSYIRTPLCSFSCALITTVAALATSLIWILIAAITALPTGFFLIILYQCLSIDGFVGDQCLDFTITGLVFPLRNATVDYGRLCGVDMIEFCNSYALLVTYRLYVMMFVGALLTCLGMILFSMIMTANLVYTQTFPRISYYFETLLPK